MYVQVAPMQYRTKPKTSKRILTTPQGASPGELLIEACRRNNTDLLADVISTCGGEEKAAELLNNTKTVLGNYIYHEAALRGNCEWWKSQCGRQELIGFR